jgi:hypothetical protein
MNNLILGYKRGWNKWHTLVKALWNIDQDVDVVTEDFDKIIGPYDRIFTVAESLLPIQVELEQKWGLNNLSKEAANILSDKKMMDDFCISIGLKDFIPDSVIPKSPKDLDIFKDRPFIIKPTVGSGTAKRKDIDYISFNNKDDFLLSIDKSFFINNQKGLKDKQFNNRLNYYIAQEQLPIEAEIWGPYYYGTKCLLWSKSKIRFIKIDECSYEARGIEWMSVHTSDVPIDVQEKCTYFMNTIIEKLKLKNIFFSGPDFYKWDSNLKMIDANPRLGQGLQIIDSIHNYNIIPNILLEKDFSIDKNYLWSISTLKPGKIKSISDISHLKKYLAITNPKLKPGMIIPEFQHLQMADRIALYIEGINESDMRKTYQTVNNQLQDCIKYI